MRGDKRARQTNTLGDHRAYYIVGSEDRAVPTKYNGRMIFQDKEGNTVKAELRLTGKQSIDRGN